MFNGEFTHSLDDKGRLVFPMRFRCLLGEKFIITRGLQGCLFVFTATEWNSFEQQLRERSFLDPKAVMLQRFFCGPAAEVSVDGQFRVQIPQVLRDYAGLKDEVKVVGASNRVEIWSREKWDATLAEITPEMLQEAAAAIGMTGVSNVPAS